MKSLRIPGPPSARRWIYRAAALVAAVLTAGSLAGPAGATTGSGSGSALAQAPNPAAGVTMGAAAPSASSVLLAYTGTDGAVYLRNVTNGVVTGLGGRLIGGPAVVQTPTGLAVFGRGTDNALWWTHQVTSLVWSSWQSLGGVITSAPAAAAGATVGSGPLVALARGSNGALWARVQATNGTWSGWHSLGGVLLSGTGPAAVTALGNLVIAVTGTNHHVWLYGPLGMQVFGFIDFGGVTSSTPGITATSVPVGVPVFARGTDNALWYKVSALPVGNPAGWTSLGGRLTSGPAAATVRGGKTYVFALGTDNLPWMRNGIWPSLGGWTRA
jgi:hypothetical protein